MLPTLLVVLGLYLAGCYCYGMYLVVRLVRGRRVKQTLAGHPPRRIVRATARYEPDELVTYAEQEASEAYGRRAAA